MEIVATDRYFEISFEYDARKVADLQRIKGAQWRKVHRKWFVPIYLKREVEYLKEKYGVDVAEYEDVPVQAGEIPPMPELDVEIPLLIKPRHYQETGIAYCRANKRCIVGDDMGLGKTMQAIATAVSLDCKCILIICPATLKLNWQIEFMKFAGKRTTILSDKNKGSWQTYQKVGWDNIFIVNYESLKKYFVKTGWEKPNGTFKIKDIPFRECIDLFDCVIVDESSKVKDGTRLQSKLVIGICKGKPVVLELSGTPVVNKPYDLISQLLVIGKLRDVVDHIPMNPASNKPDLSGYNRFLHRYCEGGRGAANLKELNYRLQITGSFYRREKKEVLTELPDKVRQIIYCEITNKKEYDRAENDFENYLKEVRGCTDAEIKKKLRGEMMVKIGILKQISARGKIEAAQQYIEEVNESGQKIIVFCHLKEIARELKSLYPEFVTIVGDDSMEDRQRNITAFQNNQAIIGIICSLSAAGMGVTLTAASETLLIEQPWTYALCDQAESRNHRIGQVQSCRNGYLLGRDTIDEWCWEIILKKKDIAAQITGSSVDAMDEIVNSLTEYFERKKNRTNE